MNCRPNGRRRAETLTAEYAVRSEEKHQRQVNRQRGGEQLQRRGRRGRRWSQLTEEMGLRDEPICLSTWSSHLSGPFRCTSIQQGVDVMSCRWYSWPQPVRHKPHAMYSTHTTQCTTHAPQSEAERSRAEQRRVEQRRGEEKSARGLCTREPIRTSSRGLSVSREAEGGTGQASGSTARRCRTCAPSPIRSARAY